jgi:hypothetical protein
MLGAAQAAQAAALDVKLPPVTGREDAGGLGARVETPVVDVGVQASSGRISVSVTAPPPPSVEIPLPGPSKPAAEPSAPGAAKRDSSRPEKGRAPTDDKRRKPHTTTSEAPVPPASPSGRAPVAAESVGAPPSPSSPPEATLFAVDSLAAAAAGSSGATAALIGLVLVAIAFLSWIALQLPRRLSPPLLSFALQRPG